MKINHKILNNKNNIKVICFVIKLILCGLFIRFSAVFLISIYGIFIEREGFSYIAKYLVDYFSPPYFVQLSFKDVAYILILGPLVETIVLYPFLKIDGKRPLIRMISLIFVMVAAYVLHGGGLAGLMSAWAFMWFLLIGWKFSREMWKSMTIVAFVHASANFNVLIFSA